MSSDETRSITGRDGLVTAKALFVAIQTLRRLPHPPLSDISDMEKILDQTGFREQLEFTSQIKKAVRLGWRPPKASDPLNDDPANSDQAGIGPEKVERWLAAHPSEDSVIDLFDDVKGG